MEGITVQSTSHVAWFAFAAGFYRDGSELHVFLFSPYTSNKSFKNANWRIRELHQRNTCCIELSTHRCKLTHPPTQTHTHTLLWAYSRKPPNFSTLLVLSANADRLLSQLGSKALWAEMNNFPVKQLHVFIMLPCPVVPTYCIHLAYWKKTSSYIKFIGVFFGSKGGLPNNVGANAGFGFEQGESKTQHSTWVVLNKQFS